MFKKRRSIKIPYNKQGLTYFACMDVKDMPEAEAEKIKQICSDVAGEYAEALYTLVTNDKLTVEGVANRYFMSSANLYNYRTKFYYKISPKIKVTIDMSL